MRPFLDLRPPPYSHLSVSQAVDIRIEREHGARLEPCIREQLAGQVAERIARDLPPKKYFDEDINATVYTVDLVVVSPEQWKRSLENAYAAGQAACMYASCAKS